MDKQFPTVILGDMAIAFKDFRPHTRMNVGDLIRDRDKTVVLMIKEIDGAKFTAEVMLSDRYEVGSLMKGITYEHIQLTIQEKRDYLIQCIT